MFKSGSHDVLTELLYLFRMKQSANRLRNNRSRRRDQQRETNPAVLLAHIITHGPVTLLYLSSTERDGLRRLIQHTGLAAHWRVEYDAHNRAYSAVTLEGQP